MGNTRSSSSNNSEVTGSTRAPARRGTHSNPWMLIILAFIMWGFWALIATLQIQTSEARVNGQQQNSGSITAEWDIWLQVPRLMFGSAIPSRDIGPDDLDGVIIGQVVELSYVALTAGLEIALHTTQKWGRIGRVVMIIGLACIAIFDFCSDLSYGNVSLQTHVAFAALCTLVIGFFPTWATALMEHGWKRA